MQHDHTGDNQIEMRDLACRTSRETSEEASHTSQEQRTPSASQPTSQIHPSSEARPTQSTHTLTDLSNMLQARGRLQQLGCLFSPQGELVTYGNPDSNSEFEEQLRMGPCYHEQWSKVFTQSRNQYFQQDAELWPDLRMLKRALGNEGVRFSADHRRRSQGDGSERVLQLCIAYDAMRRVWARVSPTDLMSSIEKTEEKEEYQFHESGCYAKDGDECNCKPHNSSARGRVMSKARGRREESPPRHIGWRFSDEIDEATAATLRSSLSLGDEEEAEQVTLLHFLKEAKSEEPDNPEADPVSQSTSSDLSSQSGGPSSVEVRSNQSGLSKLNLLIGDQDPRTKIVAPLQEAAAPSQEDDAEPTMLAEITTTGRGSIAGTVDPGRPRRVTEKKGWKVWLRAVFCGL